MARPALNEEKKRVVQVNIRLTQSEGEKVNTFAESAGLSPANWIRYKIFTGKFPQAKASPLDAAIFRELQRIGINVNQVAHKLNSNEFSSELRPVLDELSGLLKVIVKLLVHDRRSDEG
jgi:type IV pilus biogenesis protein CpaD/CtpE